MTKYILSLLTLLLSISLHAQEAADTSYQAKKSAITYVETIVRENPVTLFPAANPLQQLQGRASGMFATTASGRPGSPAILLIRGQNSIDGDSEPYYIVNDVPYTSQQLSTINVEDIESITILKDAISTAPYGVNGGNGVVVIETKKGRPSQSSVTISAETGFSKILKNKFGLMNTRQKLDYELGLGLIDQTTYNERLPHSYNHIDEIFRTAWLQQYNLQLSGGNDRTTYYLSGGYYTQDGILEKSNFKRYTVNADVNMQASKWLKAGINIYLGKENSSNPPTSEVGNSYVNNDNNLALASILLNPYEQLRNPNGAFNKNLIGFGSNPLYEASLFTDELTNTNISGTGYLDVRFNSKLNLKSSVVLSQYEAEEYLNSHTHDSKHYTKDFRCKETAMIQTNRLNLSTYLDNHSKHRINASLSHELRITNGMLNNETHEYLSASYSYNKIKDNENKVLSGTAELKYSYKDYLLFDATYRIDKMNLAKMRNSKTTESWAVAGKWIAYDKSYGFLSRMSLKASTGKVAHLPLNATSLSYKNLLMLSSIDFSLNSNLIPYETTQTHNIGIDVYFLKNRLCLFLEWYIKNTSDVFVAETYHIIYPIQQLALTNAAEVQNKGFELSASYNILNQRDYFLDISANLTLNKNELKKNRYITLGKNNQVAAEGLPLGSYSLSQWAGVNPNTGDATWYDYAGNKSTSTGAHSNKYIDNKSCIPSKQAGLSLSGGYKNFSLSALFYGIWDIYTYNQNLYYLETSNGRYAKSYNQTTQTANYWKNPGDITDIPKPFSNISWADTRLLQNHSYLRLRSLTLAYEFNRRILYRVSNGIEKCKLFVTAHNLFTITGYRGFTPEVLGAVDYGNYPESRTFSWGIKLTFK